MRTRKSVRLNPSSYSSPSEIIVEPGADTDADPVSKETKRIDFAIKLALQNPLIVHELMGYLNTQDLMICRFVSKMWKSLSSSILLRRDCFIVKLKYADGEKIFEQQQPEIEGREGDTPRQLKELNNLLQESPKEFPCTNFGFLGGNLGDVEPQRFFRLNGENIQTLEFSSISLYCRGGKRKKKNEEKSHPSCFTSKSVFRKILLRSIPHVKTMTFKSFDFKWSEGEKIDLTSLKMFSWEGAMRTALIVLQGARNLQVVKRKLTSEDTLMLGNCHNEAALKAAVYSLREGLRKLQLQSQLLVLQMSG